MSNFVWHPTEDLLHNSRVAQFMRQWDIDSVAELRRRSAAEQRWFWPALLEHMDLRWDTEYTELFDDRRGAPWTDWFIGGELNIVTNCLDRHARGQLQDHVCLVSRTETGEKRELTFSQLDAQVKRCAAALRSAGIKKGDRVASYMPMIEDVVTQMLATLKIGAIFIPIFSGYAPAALAERMNGAGARLLFTTTRSSRKGRPIPILPAARMAVAQCPTIETVVVVERPALDKAPSDALEPDILEPSEQPTDGPGRPDGSDEPDQPTIETAKSASVEVDWNSFLASGAGHPQDTLSVEAMHPALILFTSGTTGRPKGTVHSHAGTLVQLAKEVGYAFDMRPSDHFFWFTDIGWMMGPWTIIGGLYWGACVHLYEGAIDYPERDQLWRLLEEDRISVFGISPTAIRMLMRSGCEDVEAHDLRSLRLLGSTGEPWDEESWHWYFEHVGGSNCPVINISGGTDIIGCFLSPLPVDALKPCSLAGPGLGMAVDVWNEEGESVRGEVGYLVATHPAPSMTRGLWNDRERYLESYWSRWPGIWNHGDWALVDEDGQWFLQGRSDDTLKVAGRRIGPAELEGALIETGKVTEAATIGVPHDIKGTGIVCFVVLKPGHDPSPQLEAELEQAIVERLGKVDRPERIVFVDDLPKTRSAKILRRLVRARYLGEDLGDLSSVQNPEAIEGIPVG